MSTTDISSEKTNDSLHKLNDKWTLWAHLPHDVNWDVDSYKKIFSFDTVEEARAYESAYLAEVNAVKSEQWLNKNNSGKEFGGCDKGRPCTWGDKVGDALRDKSKSAEHKAKLSNTYVIKCSNGMQWYFATTREAKRNGIFQRTIENLRKGPYRVKYAKKIAGTIVEKGAVLTMKETRCTQSKQSLIR